MNRIVNPAAHHIVPSGMPGVMQCMAAVLLCAALSGCATSPPKSAPAPVPPVPERLVLALDGVAYRDIVEAQQKGMFAGFRAPSRVISTYPSISDIAWHEIFGVQPPRGYQRMYFSVGYNSMMGERLDAIRPIEFESRMDLAFGTKFHHLGAYIISNKIARGEVDKTVRTLFEINDRKTIYVYHVGPDAMQHMRGDFERYVQHLDAELSALQVEYKRRTGRALQIAIVSDHGHNRSNNARFLPINDALKARGFKVEDRLKSPNDVAFSIDGVTTAFGLFCDPDSVESLGHLLADMQGIDVVTTFVTNDRFHVLAGRGDAWVERRRDRGKELFRYQPGSGDPLRYARVMARMQSEGALDADGWADAEQWVKYTSAESYPAAPVRIVRGHTSVTLNPAPVLASLTDSYRMGLGMLNLANHLRPLGGTHGALSAANSLGVLMTNYQDTHDALTSTVREQLGGFDDLKAPDWKAPGARITTWQLLTADRLGPFRGMQDASSSPGAAPSAGVAGPNVLPESSGRTAMNASGASLPLVAMDNGEPGIEMWLSPVNLQWAGEGASFVIDTKLLNSPDDDGDHAHRVIWPLRTTMQSKDRTHYFFGLEKLGLLKLAPDAMYEVRLAIHHPAVDGTIPPSSSSKVVTTIRVRTNSAGEVWAY